MKKLTCLIILLLFYPDFTSYSLTDPALKEWLDFSQAAGSRQLAGWLRCMARAVISGNKCSEQLKISTPQFYGKLGIFVTLKKGKNVRGCYGAFFHIKPDIAEVLSDYLSGALTRDPRYKPLGLSELEHSEIIITITSQPFAVNDLNSIDTLIYGISITCGDGATTVYVPYELRGVQDLQKYFRKQECQVSAFEAVTIR